MLPTLAWCLTLGDYLKRLPLIHNLLRFFEDKAQGKLIPRSYPELQTKLEGLLGLPANTETDYLVVLIDSLLSLMAKARSQIQKHDGSWVVVPWINLRVQVWFRELKRMVASVAALPKLHFSDDLAPEELKHSLPILHCRCCGATGWGGVRPHQGADRLQLNDLKTFYQAFFHRRPTLTVLFPVPEGQNQLDSQKLCPHCFTLNSLRREHCLACGQRGLIPVQVPDLNREESLRQGQKKTFASRDCPFCQSRNGLSIVGAQSASLTSALIGVLFTTPFNTDKKLLTFSDSVQDAAHRAGFYSARTYRTTLRTAIAEALRQAPPEINLEDFTTHFGQYWQQQLPTQADFVATFLPNDLAWLREWDDFVESNRRELPADSTLIEKVLQPRLTWEILTQFGHRSAVGPSLERSGICSLQFSAVALTAAVAQLQQRLSNEIEALRTLQTSDIYPYLLGFLHHLRQAGAIHQAATKAYIQGASNTFLLQKPLYMPPIGPGIPKPTFMANASANAQNFELLDLLLYKID